MNKLAPFFIAGYALSALLPGVLHAQNAVSHRPAEQVTLNFSNADIADVARTIAVMTGRNVVVDPRVKGTINLVTDKGVSKAAAYDQFLAALRLQGFSVVESAGLYKVVPEADAKLQGGSVSIAPATSSSGNQIVTQIFRLNYETANNLVPILRPLISPNNTINVNPGNNSLVITDYADNLQRMARIVAALDLPSAGDLEIIPLKHAVAADLVPLLVRLIDSGGVAAAAQGQADNSFKTAIVAEPRSNSVIVRAANPARSALARSLVERLDQPSGLSAAGNIYVVYLKNADAMKLAGILRASIASSGGAGGASATAPSTPGAAAAAQGVAASAQPSTGGQIQADPATNSLIISASEPLYRQLRAVIDQLDGRRAQVYVESLIAEVDSSKAAQFGIQWQNALGSKSSNIGVFGTNSSVTGTNIVALATGATKSVSSGFNFALGSQVGGKLVLSMLANFLESTGDGNILSTPNLLTLDNEEAKIVIGQNVPFVTGQYTNNNAGSSGTVNPFQTIERKDVGLTLRVKPQISENGTIKLQIYQEVSSVQNSSVGATSGLITNKRSIESTVLVDDGAIVVLGGLLQDTYAGNQDKVPGVADIPFFGNLFKSESRSRTKTNLMVFLRPVVIRDAQSSEALSLDRYELMRAQEKEAQPVRSSTVPVNESAVMPPLGAPAMRVLPPLSLPQTVPAAPAK